MTQVAPDLINKAHVRAINDQVVIIPIREKREDMTTAGGVIMDLRVSPGGIAIPDEVDNTEIEGIVVGLGDGVRYEMPSALAERLAARLSADWTHASGLGVLDTGWLAMRIQDEAAKPLPFTVKVGDRVLFVPWLCSTVVLEGTDYNICAERDIVGIFTD